MPAAHNPQDSQMHRPPAVEVQFPSNDLCHEEVKGKEISKRALVPSAFPPTWGHFLPALRDSWSCLATSSHFLLFDFETEQHWTVSLVTPPLLTHTPKNLAQSQSFLIIFQNQSFPV